MAIQPATDSVDSMVLELLRLLCKAEATDDITNVARCKSTLQRWGIVWTGTIWHDTETRHIQP